MVKSFNIKKLHICFVLRHYWEKREGYERYTEFRDWRIGLWYKKTKMVGSKNFNKPKEWGNNLVKSHMFGINLLVIKCWITTSIGGKHLKIDKA